jgi:hypothetical protein
MSKSLETPGLEHSSYSIKYGLYNLCVFRLEVQLKLSHFQPTEAILIIIWHKCNWFSECFQAQHVWNVLIKSGRVLYKWLKTPTRTIMFTYLSDIVCADWAAYALSACMWILRKSYSTSLIIFGICYYTWYNLNHSCTDKFLKNVHKKKDANKVFASLFFIILADFFKSMQ